jgi:hypothetical protein
MSVLHFYQRFNNFNSVKKNYTFERAGDYIMTTNERGKLFGHQRNHINCDQKGEELIVDYNTEADTGLDGRPNNGPDWGLAPEPQPEQRGKLLRGRTE